MEQEEAVNYDAGLLDTFFKLAIPEIVLQQEARNILGLPPKLAFKLRHKALMALLREQQRVLDQSGDPYDNRDAIGWLLSGKLDYQLIADSSSGWNSNIHVYSLIPDPNHVWQGYEDAEQRWRSQFACDGDPNEVMPRREQYIQEKLSAELEQKAIHAL